MEAFRRRLRLIVFLVSGFPLALAAVAYTFYQYVERYEQEVHWLERRAQRIAELVAPILARQDANAVFERLTTVGLEGSLQAAQIYDTGNFAVAEVGVAGWSADSHMRSAIDGADFQVTRLIYQRPIEHDGSPIGRIVLDADLRPLYRGLLETGVIGLITITLAFFLAFTIASRFEKRVVNRLATVADVAERGARYVDEQPPVVVPEGEEELAELARAVNTLVTKYAEANRRLRANQAYYRSLLNHVVDLIFVVDGECRIRFVNSAVQAQLGYAPGSLVNRSLCQFVVPWKGEGDSPKLMDQIEKIGAAAVEWEFKHRDGSTRTYELRASNQLENPAVSGIVIGCHDVTERDLLEEEVGWKDQLLDVIFENIPALVYLKDSKEQRYVRLNRSMVEFLGKGRDEVVGKTDFELFPKSIAKRNRASDVEALLGKGVHEHKGLLLPSATGEERWVDKKAVGIIPDDQGEPRYILVIGEEITVRERLRRRLQASEERYRQVVENAGEAFFLLDTEGRLLDVNGRACESLGYTRAELLALSITDIEVDSDEPDRGRWWLELEGERPLTLAREYRRRDGSRLAVEVRCSVWVDADQRYIIALVREGGSGTV